MEEKEKHLQPPEPEIDMDSLIKSESILGLERQERAQGRIQIATETARAMSYGKFLSTEKI